MTSFTSRTINISVLVVALLGAMLALLFSSSLFAHAKQPVQWIPKSINEALPLGETKVISVTLTSDKSMPRVVVRVSPEIVPYVSVTPTTIGKIRKGKSITLTLTVTIPIDALPTTASGVIELQKSKHQDARDERDDDDDGTWEVARKTGNSLPVTIDIVAESLPPDPGEAGKVTLEGIDSDRDGVRDDVQRYIVLTVPESARHREALKSVAIVTQRELLAQSKEEAIQAAVTGVRSIECLSYLGVRKQGRWKEVEALMLNTEARLRAMEVHSDRITGQIFDGLPYNLKRTACTFNVEALPN